MKKELLKIINNYGVMPQLEYFMTEVAELIEAIANKEEELEYPQEYWEDLEHKEAIAGEITDCLVMVNQFPLYYYEKLDENNIAPYEFKTDNYQNMENVDFVKDFMKSVFKLNCAVIIAEEREQDYISEYLYENVTYAVDEVIYKLLSIKEYYHIPTKDLRDIGEYKINRQIERIENENNRVMEIQ